MLGFWVLMEINNTYSIGNFEVDLNPSCSFIANSFPYQKLRIITLTNYFFQIKLKYTSQQSDQNAEILKQDGIIQSLKKDLENTKQKCSQVIFCLLAAIFVNFFYQRAF